MGQTKSDFEPIDMTLFLASKNAYKKIVKKFKSYKNTTSNLKIVKQHILQSCPNCNAKYALLTSVRSCIWLSSKELRTSPYK